MVVNEVPEVTNYRKIKIVTYSFGDSSSRLGESVHLGIWWACHTAMAENMRWFYEAKGEEGVWAPKFSLWPYHTTNDLRIFYKVPDPKGPDSPDNPRTKSLMMCF